MPIKRTMALALLLLLYFSLTPPAAPGQAAEDQSNPNIQAMLDQVDPGIIKNLSRNLSGEWPVAINGEAYTIPTRYALSGEPIQKTTQYLFQYYQDLGLDVSLNQFNYGGQVLSNVIAEKRGTVFPERIFMITSHFDAVNGTPGMDDNGSGTVAVMMAASILNQYEFGCTLRFANFNAEEFGMVGSEHYAHQSYCAGEDLRGVINLDMIAWNTPDSPTEFDLHALPSVPGSMEIAEVFQDIVQTYGLNLIPTMGNPFISASDHASFLRFGFPAILASEDGNDFNPYYHKVGDNLDNLPDFEYYTEAVKASLGTLAHIGCLVEDGWGTIEGVVTENNSMTPIPNTSISLNNPDWDYTFGTYTDEEGYYQLSVLEGWHNLTADGIGYTAANYAGLYITNGQSLNINIELEPTNEKTIYLPLSISSPHDPLPGCP
ncbi:MAG: M28 family peptidase [Anaerolineales bacterium]